MIALASWTPPISVTWMNQVQRQVALPCVKKVALNKLACWMSDSIVQVASGATAQAGRPRACATGPVSMAHRPR